jgi:hypothetical protein
MALLVERVRSTGEPSQENFELAKLDINIMASLILAQDKRWRRA